jgi:hypothetical protein
MPFPVDTSPHCRQPVAIYMLYRDDDPVLGRLTQQNLRRRDLPWRRRSTVREGIALLAVWGRGDHRPASGGRSVSARHRVQQQLLQRHRDGRVLRLRIRRRRAEILQQRSLEECNSAGNLTLKITSIRLRIRKQQRLTTIFLGERTGRPPYLSPYQRTQTTSPDSQIPTGW